MWHIELQKCLGDVNQLCAQEEKETDFVEWLEDFGMPTTEKDTYQRFSWAFL